MLTFIFVFIFSFFIGSIPFGYIFVKKYRGIDIRTVGSGNIGSTNVARIVGKKVAILTQLCDLSKGIIPVGLTIIMSNKYSMNHSIMLQITSAFGTILGHDFSPFLQFNGGKGVNTTLGAFLLIIPIPVLLSAISFKLMRIITPIVSIRSMIAILFLPIYTFIFHYSSKIIFATFLASLLIIIMHYGNIKRLMKNKEN